MRARRERDAGLTLIELLITVVLLGIIVAPIAASFVVAFRNIGGTVEGFTDGNDLLNASSFFMSDVQDADVVDTSRIAQGQVDLKAVRFADGTTGYVAGSRGVVLRTDDQGASYYPLATGITKDLFGIGIVSGNSAYAWAFGADATIIRTTDGGASWAVQSVPAGVTGTLRRGHFRNINEGVIVGDSGTVLRTTNGGSTWTKQVSGTTRDLHAVSFRNSNDGVAVGASGVTLRTGDFGSSWEVQTNAPPMTSTLRGVYIRDDSAGWVVGDRDPVSGFRMAVCTKFCTRVNPTWSAVANPGTQHDIRAITGVSRQNVWAAVADGMIVHCNSNCDSASATWTPQETGVGENINAIHAIDSTHIWAVADAATLLRSIYNRWVVQPAPPGFTQRLNSVSCFDSSNCLAVGHSGSSIVTSNGGASWVTQSTGTAQNLRSVVYVSSSTALAVGDNGVIRVCTSNCDTASASWAVQVSTATASFYGVFWASKTEAYAVGTAGTMRVCTSNCDKAIAVWVAQAQVVPVLSTINAVHGKTQGGPAGSEAFAVGNLGRIFVCSSNCDKAAAIWTQTTSPTTQNLQSIACDSSNSCLAVGDNGTILQCTSSCKNTSSTWTLQDPGTSANLNRVRYVSSTVAYVSGSGGTILVTDDGGATWSTEATPVSANLFGLAAPTAANQWAVGGNGTIISTVSGGASTWFYASDEALEEVPAKVCPGTETILVSFWSTDPDGSEYATTYLIRNSGGDRVLVRQVCTRPKGASIADPFTLVNELAIVRGLAPTGDPSLSCLGADGTSAPCSTAVRLRLSFANPDGPAYSIQGTRR